ncbi:tetratricopeptide repeat protein [Pseudomonas mangiferae]|uniref:Uncharacterized protein n=1 Tax=Pseudomonas mangiferae TaxID=2593654 RepID=A0A553H353_9PSED|nr:hypothetical protein [Pseudomonas mangiferae]TRX76165.1 hypothetical protein FM069_02965 [Pseudomonas mangiferae]
MINRVWGLAPFAIIVALTALYWPVTNFDYVWDDTSLFLDSPLLRSPSDLWRSISTAVLPGSTYFRPGVLLSFIVEFQLFGVDSKVSHSINLLIYLANCTLVYGLAYQFNFSSAPKQRLIRSLLAMSLYGFHPVLMESTVWVACRFDLMVTFFTLLGLWLGRRYQERLGLFLVCACFAAAAASKEMAVVFPVLIVMWLWLNPENKGVPTFIRHHKTLFLCLLLVGFVYLWVRHLAQPALYAADYSIYEQRSIFEKIGYVGQTLLFYAKMVVFPFSDLNPLHPFEVAKITQKQVGVGMLTLFFAMIFSVWGFYKRIPCFYFLAMGLVALLPVLNILPLVISGNIGHERFLALPLSFFALGASSISISLNMSEAMKRTFPFLVSACLVGWAVLCVANIRITLPLWSNEISLWGWGYERNPDFEFVRFNYVAALLFSSQSDLADEVLKKVEERDGGLSYKLTALKGQLTSQRGDYAEATKYLEKSIEGLYKPHEEVLSRKIDINKAMAVRDNVGEAWLLRFVYGALAESYMWMGQYTKALDNVNYMIFYQRDYAPAYMLKAFVYYAMGDKEKGDEFSRVADTMFPDESKVGVKNVRKLFFTKLCENEGGPKNVCQAYKEI